MLLHGNLMCRRQFEDLIPLLEEEYCVYAVSFDGFDGTRKAQYGSARRQAGSAVWGNRSAAAHAQAEVAAHAASCDGFGSGQHGMCADFIGGRQETESWKL